MSGFDENQIFTSHPRPGQNGDGEDGDEAEGQEVTIDVQAYKKHFKEFIRNYWEGNFNYKYRVQLHTNYNIGKYWIEVNIQELNQYNPDLGQKLVDKPADFLPLFEEAAKEMADELTHPRPGGQEEVREIQVMLSSAANSVEFRDLNSDQVSRLVKISGIVVTASSVRIKAESISIMCRSCRSVIPDILIKRGLDGYQLPRKCITNQGAQAADVKCSLDPYFIMADKSRCADFQVLKLQECPEGVPPGEMPRHMLLYCDKFLCEKAVPGNRVTVNGIYSIKKPSQSKKSAQNKVAVGVRFPYMRVVGIQLDMDGSGRSAHVTYTPEEEESFRRLAASPDCYERIARSIAPSIYGAEDIKKAIACLLFAGSRKRLPDGLTRRGDINVLLLGDPGTAKSQLLKFVEKVSPIAIYTSGKGSSAAGLTASINRDPATKNFFLEGGAMVLADGGVVCIDEFDKMREDDRVAIHEAMEQQTISIAKAGITTTLNSRCAVFAAANSIFGRWDEMKGDENIDFMPTILSRFDMIFIVKDEHSERRDTTMAKHVMKVHMEAQKSGEQLEAEGELSLLFLKKYIAYCHSRCGPRLSESASEKLTNRYVLMRSGNREQEIESEKKNPIPITVRQLEAIIRIAEALAKMQLLPFATETHIDEALRLFQVSTLEAANTGSLAGVEGFTTPEDHELLCRLEVQLKRRFPIGSQVSEQVIVRDFLRQHYPEPAITKVIQTLVRREEFQRRLQGKVLYRLK